jgi:hypothetical protein
MAPNVWSISIGSGAVLAAVLPTMGSCSPAFVGGDERSGARVRPDLPDALGNLIGSLWEQFGPRKLPTLEASRRDRSTPWLWPGRRVRAL